MTWPTIIWSVGAGIDLALACLNLLVWMKSRDSWANLLFSIAAFSVVVISMIELQIMHVQTPEEFVALFRWLHVPVGILIVATAWFLHLYLRAGRAWLVWLLCAHRVLILVAAFVFQPSLDFRAITALHQVSAWGENLVIAEVEQNPWYWFSQSANILFIIVVFDTVMAARRQGNGRRAAVVGCGILAALVLGMVMTVAFHLGKLPVPYSTSLVFLFVVMAIAYELGLDLINAKQISRELHQSQERVSLVTSAAKLGLWEWDVIRDEFWSSVWDRKQLGIGESERIDLECALRPVLPEDRDRVRQAIRAVLDDGQDLLVEYRVIQSDNETIWKEAFGKVDLAANGKPQLIRGVAIDISARKVAAAALKQSEAKSQELRNELIHVQRVSGIGQLSSTLAHELNQPLGAILRNAEAGELFLQKRPPDIEEVQVILADILQDTKRAASVIERMRSLLKWHKLEFETLAIEELVRQVMAMLHTEAQARQINLHLEVPQELPGIRGDRVQLQQVILNLMLNSMDAMEQVAKESRRIVIKITQRDDRMIELAVADRGTGIQQDFLPHVFEPFRTTKEKGIGFGLAISKTIIELHGGRIFAENNQEGGATIRFTLRVAEQQARHE